MDGRWFLTFSSKPDASKIFREHQLKTALRKVAEHYRTSNFVSSPEPERHFRECSRTRQSAAITALLAEHGVKTEKQAVLLHAGSMACPALPTCGLALAESERMLPGLIDRIEKLGGELGLAGEEIIIRSTGCPNGCARLYMAEIAFVGKAPGRYQLWLGGDAAGTRLNRVWKDMVKDPEIENELRPLAHAFRKGTHPSGERFGDWCDSHALEGRAGSPPVN